MKIFLIFIPIFIFTQFKIFSQSEIGCFDPYGHRAFIFTGELNETLFSKSPPTPTQDFPNSKNFDFFYSPNQHFSIDYKQRDSRTSYMLEFKESIGNFSINQFNLYSQNSFGIDELVHHGGEILWESNSITTGGEFIWAFSTSKRTGYRIVTYNKLRFNNLELSNLSEIREFYTTPLYIEDENRKRVKSGLLLPIKKLDMFYTNDLILTESYNQRVNKLEFIYHFPWNTLSVTGQIRDRIKREYTLETNLKSRLWLTYNETNIKIRYINGPLYYLTTTSTLSLKDIKLSLLYKYELEIKEDQSIGINLKIDKSSWKFSMKYNQPIYDEKDFWTIDASITHKY